MEAHISFISHYSQKSQIIVSKKKDETFKEMSVSIFTIAIPVIIAMSFSLAVQIVNIAVVGHLGDTAKVAGVGLGNLYLNMFC